MKILVIDGGGRGHALAKKYLESKKTTEVLAIPGNDLMTLDKIRIFPDIKTTDIPKILQICKKEKVDLVDVAQDDAIAAGLVDTLRKSHIKVFGPKKETGKIEWDKSWSRNFMRQLKLPAPSYNIFNLQQSGIDYINSQPNNKWYVKASGLAAGKGAIFAKNKKDAVRAIKEMSKFGNAGSKYLIEQCLEGEEFSAFALVNAEKFQIVGYAQDHKKALDGDIGPNTGGMGCSSPPKIMSKNIEDQIYTIFKKTTTGLVKLKRPYTGILYLGGIIDGNGKVWIIEFNARWGDPEAQVILPAIKNDYYNVVTQTLSKAIPIIRKDKKYRLVVTAASKGYPGDYSKVDGRVIHGFENLIKKAKVFGAGIKKSGNNWQVAGGRLFYVLGEGTNVAQARKIAYNALSHVSVRGNNLHFRKDIGYRDMSRLHNARSKT